MFQRILFLLTLSVLLFSCGNNKTTKEGTTDKMAKHANDENFKNQHETPEKIDFTPKGEMIKIPVAEGDAGNAYSIKAKASTNNYLFVIHEWYGLNDHIKREAERLHEELGNVNVLALDMYDGKVADNPEDASKYMKASTEERSKAIINGALKMAGDDAKVGTIGWCFGGGWSLQSSIMAGKQGVGCVIYYGSPVENAKELVDLNADVLGIFGDKDAWINPKVVTKFDALMKATGKNFTFKIFDADHAFANPSSPRYVEAAAQEANAMALTFLKERLK